MTFKCSMQKYAIYLDIEDAECKLQPSPEWEQCSDFDPDAFLESPENKGCEHNSDYEPESENVH